MHDPFPVQRIKTGQVDLTINHGDLTLGGLLALTLIFPLLANNYMIDVGITCLIYILLGLGLNIVVGLAGLLGRLFASFSLEDS